jgi:hypothetical protein
VRINYVSYNQFISKAAILAHEMALPQEEAHALLARLSGYGDECDVAESDSSTYLLSRQDLIRRLMQLRPDICLLRSASIIDTLDFPVQEVQATRPSNGTIRPAG